MRVQILHVADCPNVAPLEARIAEVVGGRGDVEVTLREIGDVEEAAAAGMIGSPTLLVDGVDPFAVVGQAPSLSCRLYRDSTGRAAGTPSRDDLRRALDLTMEDECGADCCSASPTGGPSPDPPLEALRSTRARAALLDPATRTVQQAILRAFAATGHPPTPAEVEAEVTVTSLGRPVAEVLAELHDRDVIRLGHGGEIRVAYPFSAAPTRHQVRLVDGTDVFAMCAVDALGIPAMLDTDAVITSTDPAGDAEVTVKVVDGRATWTPHEAVVFVGVRVGGGPSADCCCDYLNFFADRATAQAWAAAHPAVPGEILDVSEAERIGADIFGSLLGPRKAN